MKIRRCRVYLVFSLPGQMFAAGLAESSKVYPALSLLGWAAQAKAAGATGETCKGNPIIVKLCIWIQIKLITEDSNAIYTIITTR